MNELKLQILHMGHYPYIFDIKCKSKRINKFLSKLKSENLIKKIDGEINKFEFKEINATKEIANHLVKLI